MTTQQGIPGYLKTSSTPSLHLIECAAIRFKGFLRKAFILSFFLVNSYDVLLSQSISITEDGSAPDSSAILDVKSTDKGMLIPRMTTVQRTMIASPAAGLLVYDNDSDGFWFYNGMAWISLSVPKVLSDADGDTKVQVEESIDEDRIRFDVAGTESMMIDNNGRIGIGTAAPAARFTMQNGALLLTGNTGGTPVSGVGRRMMWVPAKAAFRSGEVGSNQWDDVNIGIFSFVGGGFDNNASGTRSFVGGGSNNTASGVSSFVGGGDLNIASGLHSFIGGGFSNVASGASDSFVGGGANNHATQSHAFVGGGYQNTASGFGSFVGGGIQDTASMTYAFIGGGSDNNAFGTSSFVGGGENNVASGNRSFIGGGNQNTASGLNSFVGGGNKDTASMQFAFIGGGIDNNASGQSSFVGGGGNNVASATRSFIGGGNQNTASGLNSFVGGGNKDTASMENAFIGGGFDNNAFGDWSFVGGGGYNVASGDLSFIGGGLQNTASGYASFACGREAVASGNHAIAGGHGLMSESYGETVFGSYNTDYTPVSTTNFIANDRLFVIGNGTSDTSRSNALIILKNGNITIEGTLQSEAIITPTLMNSWVNYGGDYSGAGYYKDSEGVVHLRGLIKSGTNDLIMVLPVEYRPSGRLMFTTNSNNTFTRIDILSNGEVTIPGIYSNAFLSLSGISFRVD